MKIFRTEHPQPQWERNTWQNLNGEWEFDFDFGNSALDRKMFNAEGLDKKINVPFCPESELSGIHYVDFISAVCYRKEVEITKEQLNGRVVLHFGAVDYIANVYVNGKHAGKHIGGYTSFEFDITEFLNEGKNSIFVHALDDTKGGNQALGKQCEQYHSCGCSYTRTTGIWQTVWLEFVPESYIKSAKFYPNIYDTSLTIKGITAGRGDVEAIAYLDGEEVGRANAFSCGNFEMKVMLTKKLLWEVGKGGLYDLELKFGEDTVKSYFGLRNVSIDGYKVCINDKSVFQRLVLDQGFYPDGIYTAPTDDALKKDIELSVAAGFNGARLHEKVFEARFLYHADKLGYMVWAEYPNWGMHDYTECNTFNDALNGWIESMERDFNHPSIVGWCPYNETWTYIESKEGTRILETTYNITKMIDPERPCIDTSGNYHSVTDIYDIHDYDQDVETFTNRYKCFDETGDFDTSKYEPMQNPYFKETYTYKPGMPAFISEYGGIKWDTATAQSNDKTLSWGYGNAPVSEEEFIARYKGLTEALLFNKNMFGFCYTQLYDVEQEKNGLYTYERKAKFDMEIFKAINAQKAAIED